MTKILTIALAIALLALSASGYYIKTLIADVAVQEQLTKDANKETIKQKLIVKQLEIDVATEQRAIVVLGEERKNDDIKHQQALARVNEQRSRAEAVALEHPVRYGVAATYDLRRSMRDVCRRGGGSAAACKIKTVHAPTARAGNTDEPGPGAPLGLGSPQPEPSPDLPPS